MYVTLNATSCPSFSFLMMYSVRESIEDTATITKATTIIIKSRLRFYQESQERTSSKEKYTDAATGNDRRCNIEMMKGEKKIEIKVFLSPSFPSTLA